MNCIHAPYQAHSETSREAAKSISRRTLSNLHRIVYRALCSGGLTDEQGIDATGLSPSTYRPRRIELCDQGYVAKSGRREATRSGRMADVYVVTEKGRLK